MRKIQPVIDSPFDRILAVRRAFAKADGLIEVLGIRHQPAYGIETQRRVTHRARKCDNISNKPPTKTLAPKTRADIKTFHFTDIVFQRTQSDRTSRFALNARKK